jgi:plasmid maintenance system antidote protein VapI
MSISEIELAKACLTQIGWTNRGLADRIGVHETRVRRILNGALPMDPELLAWLRRLAEFHAKNPRPIDNEGR